MAITVQKGSGGSLSLMTIADLVRSSALIRSIRGKYGYSMQQALQKEFGTVYYNNKVVIYNPDSHILEIRMGIGTKTEKAYKGMHSIRMAIYGVEGTIYDSLEELYTSETGGVADAQDMNDMKKAIRGETSADIIKKMADSERSENSRYKSKEANKFSLNYENDGNVQLEGYVIPVASVDPNTGAYTYGDSGKVFYMKQPIGVNNYVRVSCSCSNYYFVHGWYNYQAGAHLGQQPAPYPGKSSSSETIYNVDKRPGMCKHLMMFTMLLLNGGIIDKAGVAGYDFNFQDLRKRLRDNDFSISRKLADSGDWGRHMRNLQSSLRNADRRHVAQYADKSLTDEFKRWERSNMARNSITFDNFMNGSRKAARDQYYSNTPAKSFAKDISDVKDFYKDYSDTVLNAENRTAKILDLFKHNK